MEIEVEEETNYFSKKRRTQSEDIMKVEIEQSMNVARIEKKKSKNNAYSATSLKECEQIAEKAVELIFNNKINAKNAFDVNVEFLENLPHLLNKNEESAWQKASASLDASAKIYGYRVDCVHTDTYRILGGLNRTDNKDETSSQNENDRKEKKDKLSGKIDGSSNLEKDPNKLDLVKFDLEFEVDPLFKNMTARFNEAGARSLLLNNLPIDTNLDILLESKEKQEKLIKNIQPLTEDIKKIIENFFPYDNFEDLEKEEITPELAYFKKDIVRSHEALDSDKQLEQSFKEVVVIDNPYKFRKNEEVNNKMIVENAAGEMANEENNNVHYNEDNNTQEKFKSAISFPSVASGSALMLENEIVTINSDEINDIVPIEEEHEEDEVNNNVDDMNVDQEGADSNNIKEINLLGRVKRRTPKKVFPVQEDFSFFKTDDLKDYISKFGDGNKEIAKMLPRLKKGMTVTDFEFFKPLAKINNHKNKDKIGKDDYIFDFNSEEEVGRNEIFDDNSTKKKRRAEEIVDNVEGKMICKKRKKLKDRYIYPHNNLLTYFSIPDRSYLEHKEDYNFDNMEEELSPEGLPMEDIKNEFTFDIATVPNVENLARVDKDYQKKFGRLYKTFDVRYLKGKIWESLSETRTKEEKSHPISFKNIISSVTNNISAEVRSNISTQTCFVCLLHLANEKDLNLEEADPFNFLISM